MRSAERYLVGMYEPRIERQAFELLDIWWTEAINLKFIDDQIINSTEFACRNKLLASLEKFISVEAEKDFHTNQLVFTAKISIPLILDTELKQLRQDLNRSDSIKREVERELRTLSLGLKGSLLNRLYLMIFDCVIYEQVKTTY